MIMGFFDNMKNDKANIFESLKMAEAEFGFEQDTKLKEELDNTRFFIKKLFKSLSKIRQLKLSFTIEDEHLIELIEKTPEYIQPQRNEIEKLFDEMNMVINNLVYELGELENVEQDQMDKKYNRNIIHFSKEYIKFFKPKSENIMEQFFVQCYLFRNDKFNEILNYTSELMNFMLNKLELYKTTIFLRYFEEILLSQIEAKVSKLSKDIDNFHNSPNPTDQCSEMGSSVFQLEVLFVFIKYNLASRKSDSDLFGNLTLETRLEPALKKLREHELELLKCKKQVSWIGEFIAHFSNFEYACADLNKVQPMLKKIKKNASALDNFKKVHDILFTYNKERQHAEHFIYETKECGVQLREYVETQLLKGNELYKEMIDILISYKI